MNGKTTPEREALLRLADALAEDVDRTSDRDLLAEAAEDHIDVAGLAAAMRGLFDQLESEAGKMRMAKARAAVDADRPQTAAIAHIDPAEARRRLAQILAHASESGRKLTLAARKAEDLSDQDVLAILENLEDLGMLLPDGDEDGKS
jgi:hypothetical protein